MADTATTESNPPSDEALMSALKAGDDQALAPLMERWELPVKAFLLRLGVPSSGVEDLAQDLFVRLYEKRARYRDGAAFKPWLLTIAGNLARNAHRRRSRHPTESLDADAEGQGTGNQLSDTASPSPFEAAARSDAARQVRDAVERLPPPLREAVLCVDFEDLSHEEAAGVMACSAKAVETRLYRARQSLREALAGLL
jgi:RNA polymerase sigma-70 factor (ECF subfamily)